MRPVCALFALLAPLLLTGCGYIHFGRLPAAPVTGTDSAMATAYSSLSTEHKILKQELVLARREGDTLRVALERAGSGGVGTADFAARLAESSRELATLRANYAKLQAERGATAPDARALAAARSDLEDKLASSLRNYTQLQEENTRLKLEVDRTRAENQTLNEQLKVATVQVERTQITLAQLNTDLVAQKEARARAEQSAEAVRAQLNTVLAHGAGASSATPREPVATPATSLQIAKAPPADSSPTAELRLNAERLRTSPSPTPAAKPPRVHIVQAGDTLEKIARQYYNAPDRWRTVYDANTALLSTGQPLRAGMELQIPEN